MRLSQDGSGRTWWRRKTTIAVVAGIVLAALSFAVVVRAQTPSRQSAGGAPVGSTGSATSNPGQSNRPAGPGRPPPVAGFPNDTTTGVPAGTVLTDYTGSCTITTNDLVIDSRVVDCDLSIEATGVTITNSRINGTIGTDEESAHSFTLRDSEVDAGVRQLAAVGTTNMTILRSDIRGGQTSVYCYTNCTIRDSWLHGQRLPAGADWHLGAFLANDNGPDPGGRTNAVLVHNTLVCDTPANSAGGGCSGNVNLFGDFGAISHVTVDNNLLGANVGISYCFYGGSSDKPFGAQASNIVVTNNVFQRGSNGKCGGYGPVTSFDTARPGNRWANNVWDDGAPVEPVS